MACAICGEPVLYGHEIEITRPDGILVLAEICMDCTYDILQQVLQDVITDFTGMLVIEDDEESLDETG